MKNIMTPVLFTLAFLFQFHGSEGITVMPTLPVKSVNCMYDSFLASAPINNKVFLHSWNPSGDLWGSFFFAAGLCAANCAEMVTIKSFEENTHFLNFASEMKASNDIWLGAEVNNGILSAWLNGEKLGYDNRANQYNGGPTTCLYFPKSASYWLGYGNCEVAKYVFCQRPANWIICM